MHLKNVTKKAVDYYSDPLSSHARSGCGEARAGVAAAGRGPGRFRRGGRRRRREARIPRGAAPAGRAAEGSGSSPLPGCPPEHTRGPSAAGAPPGAADANGWEPGWAWSAGHVPGRPRPTPGPRTSPRGTGSAGTTAPRGHRTARVGGWASRTTASSLTPSSPEGPGRGRRTQDRLSPAQSPARTTGPGRSARNPLHKSLSPDC